MAAWLGPQAAEGDPGDGAAAGCAGAGRVDAPAPQHSPHDAGPARFAPEDTLIPEDPAPGLSSFSTPEASHGFLESGSATASVPTLKLHTGGRGNTTKVRVLAPPKPPMRKSSSMPGPGEYMWNDDVNLKKKPVYTFTSPDRQNLDLLLCTWTLASASLQPRAPDPEHPGNAGRNGVYGAPSWSFDRGSGARFEPEKPKKLEVALRLPDAVGLQPLSNKRSGAQWSLMTKDRTHLPPKMGTWTPAVNSDMRPGPGAHRPERVSETGYTGRYKAITRRGSTWGTRNGMQPRPKQFTWAPPMPKGYRGSSSLHQLPAAAAPAAAPPAATHEGQ